MWKEFILALLLLFFTVFASHNEAIHVLLFDSTSNSITKPEAVKFLKRKHIYDSVFVLLVRV